MTDSQELIQTYGQSEQGNFKIIDTIGVPHSYCINQLHLKYNTSMYLGEEQIVRMERDHNNVRCDTCKKLNRKEGTQILLWNEHKKALLVECLIEATNKDGHIMIPELHQYLLKVKDLATKNGYEGFGFIRRSK